MIMMFISAVPVREEAAPRTMTAVEISPVRPALVVRPQLQVSHQYNLTFRCFVWWWRLEWGSLFLLSPGCVEVGTGLSSGLSLLLIISVS